eukprot:8345009-Alexandrium_andersonii.AAC.1
MFPWDRQVGNATRLAAGLRHLRLEPLGMRSTGARQHNAQRIGWIALDDQLALPAEDSPLNTLPNVLLESSTALGK